MGESRSIGSSLLNQLGVITDFKPVSPPSGSTFNFEIPTNIIRFIPQTIFFSVITSGVIANRQITYTYRDSLGLNYARSTISKLQLPNTTVDYSITKSSPLMTNVDGSVVSVPLIELDMSGGDRIIISGASEVGDSFLLINIRGLSFNA